MRGLAATGFARDRRGLTAPEFAVAIGTTLVMIFAIFDLGLLFAAQHTLNYGVEVAARYAVVNSANDTAANVTNAFTSAVTPAFGASGAGKCAVTVAFPSGAAPGGTVVVSVTYDWSPATSFDYLPTIALSSSQTLTIQH